MLDTSVQQAMKASVLFWLATCDAAGQPNVSPKEVVVALDAEHLLIAHIASPRSVRNLADNPKVCVSFVDVFTQKGHKVVGTASVIAPSDPRFAQMEPLLLAKTHGKFPIQALILVKVQASEPIVAPSYQLFPDTTEAMQVASAMRTYGVMPSTPSTSQEASA